MWAAMSAMSTNGRPSASSANGATEPNGQPSIPRWTLDVHSVAVDVAQQPPPRRRRRVVMLCRVGRGDLVGIPGPRPRPPRPSEIVA